MTSEMSPEMEIYIMSGRCPRCGVVIRPPFNQRLIDQLVEDPGFIDKRVKIVEESPSPRDFFRSARPSFHTSKTMQCMTCMKTWPTTCERINVASYQLIKVTGEQQTETVLSQETKLYSNQSSAKIKRRIGVTNTVSQIVTIEADKIWTSSAQASAEIFGFANIQGQIQLQLSQRYSVAVQQTLSVNEEMEIAIPPFRTIEVVITWKTVWRKGNAVLGNGSLPTVEVPYWIPLRLSFDAVPRDVAPTRERS